MRARPSQLAPEGDWRTWLFMGGRGAGKTRAGAEWVREQVAQGARSIALIAPTMHDAREVMIEGPSGLMSGEGAKPALIVSRRCLEFPNGAAALYFSAEDPASLRGPQFDAAWGDELAYWREPEAVLRTLAHALRLGANPRLMLTTTPRPLKVLKDLEARPDVKVTRASTFDNAENLAPGFIEAMRAEFSGTVWDRQELYGELIEDLRGALWARARLEKLRVKSWPLLDRVVVAVDPPASVGAHADACGIVGAGRYTEEGQARAVVLADVSVRGLAPSAWAARAAELARQIEADAIIAEANNGGEMVRTMLRMAAPDIPVRLVHATKSKIGRASPVSLLYERGAVTHAGAFAALEDEMCAFGAQDSAGSPDRVDALVWALTDLMLAQGEPRLRPL